MTAFRELSPLNRNVEVIFSLRVGGKGQNAHDIINKILELSWFDVESPNKVQFSSSLHTVSNFEFKMNFNLDERFPLPILSICKKSAIQSNLNIRTPLYTYFRFTHIFFKRMTRFTYLNSLYILCFRYSNLIYVL